MNTKAAFDSHRPTRYPLDLLARSPSTARLLQFLQAYHEGVDAATADAARAHPSPEHSSKLARGTARRDLMHRAFRSAASAAGLAVETGYNANKSWSFPKLRCGAFTLTLGKLTRRHRHAERKLSSRPDYARAFCVRNDALDPQGMLFGHGKDVMSAVIPDGTFGALIVSEHCGATPDVPSFVGIWVPSSDLRKGYHCYALDEVVAYLREKLAGDRKPVRKPVERKMPIVKRRSPKKD